MSAYFQIPLLQLCLPLISMVILILSSSYSLKAEAAQAAPQIARPGCQDSCGNVSIPFPWGIGSGCFLDKWFEIECNASLHSNASTKPLLSKFHVEVVQIVVARAEYNYSAPDPQVIIRIPPVNACSIDTHHKQPSKASSIDLRGSPYAFSDFLNVFVMEGCSGSAVLVEESNMTTVAGCATICQDNTIHIFKTNDCYGVKCCQSPLSYYLDFYQIHFNRQSSGELGQNCLLATLIESDYLVNQYAGKLPASDPSGAAPVVLTWNWISSTKPEFNAHTSCVSDSIGTTCNCNHDSIGNNPYVFGGCQVAEECMSCRGFCYRRVASNNSSYYHCVESPRFNLAAVLGLSIGLGVVGLVIGCYGVYRLIKRRREMKRRVKFFKRNGGLLLEQQLSSNEGVIERTKIFTNRELEKATDHFNENRILGQGGQGTVYKGMLTDGRIVAIKKSKLLDESQLEQFINEVVILSQINHRHVVKLLGCCLETEVPLLVYEFVPNGTLCQHIHDRDEDNVISWAMRLKVAVDSAGAIAYLHSSSSTPIYHRDIKSSNILLDDKNRAKVSDFGSSKTIAIDQTHLTTLVQGTMGYLDPEYFQSYQFNDKSDVYSFGVVLLELLTGRKPIYRDENMEQKNLVTEFLFLMANSRLLEIIDYEIVKEASEEELMMVANLAKRCLGWIGKMRPTMKEVAMALEMIINPPTEMFSEDQQAYPDEGFSEIVMLETSDVEFMSSPVPASQLYTDVQPLLRDTI